MIEEVDRLNRVVGQLLEFARPIPIARRTIDLQAFVVNSLKRVERQAAARSIHIETQLPAAAGTVLIDPDRMNQVLLNLYLNALEAMEGRGGRLVVSLAEDAPAGQVALRIADTGPGIREQDLGHVFDPYFTTKASGTGLGLAIAQKIMESHGGAIRLESQAGQGTTVTILLPEATAIATTGKQSDAET